MNAFWGYLSRGGLVLFGQCGLTEGEPVALEVHIGAQDKRADCSGVVLRSEEAGPTVVAFADAGASGSFLRAAFAGRPVDRECQVTDLDRAHVIRQARLIDLGEPGCTLALSAADIDALPVGARVELALAGGVARGDVVWARDRDRGVLFDDDPAVYDAVVGTLRAS